MKKLIAVTLFLLLVSIFGCEQNTSYFEQFNQQKPFVTRALDLNRSIEEVKKEEKGTLILEDILVLKYVYEIGKTDTYEISYLFDEKGCYEIGIDGYFEFEKDAVEVVKGIQKAMNTSAFSQATDGNSLSRWTNNERSISIELDYKDTSRGLFIATIFANS